MKLKSLFPILILLLLGQSGHAQYSDLLRIPDTISAEGRICFALYTVHEQSLKMTAQFYPIRDFEPFEASLSLFIGEEWVKVADSRIEYPGYTSHFRIDDWDDSKEVSYRVEHNETAFYTGIIRKNPLDKEEFVMAAFTGNAIYPQHGGDISKHDIVENLQLIDVDLLFFSGDQVYDHSAHLLYWLKFGRDFGDIIRNTPTICIPDDHDIGQANLWGQGGKVARTRHGNSGGYYMPVSYIQEVERAQTSHLPDPFDPTPIERGIGVYYTDLTWGGISFAILEDRKFKTGPEALTQKIRKENDSKPGADLDPMVYDVPEAVLLGERQLNFLKAWTSDWKDAEMKAVLSQTIFSQSSNHTGKHKRTIRMDFDSNGWPQSGRNRALGEIRKSYSCMIAGDQHLGSVIQMGIDQWNDAGYSFCVPSISNFWLRWWKPEEPGLNRKKGAPDYTGEFLDGFLNKMTVHAIANPTLPEIEEGGKLSTRAAGYGVIRFNKTQRTTTFECWGRNVDITDPGSQQYPGWPITIRQSDNFRIEDGYKLPELRISEPDQVVTVRESTGGEILSSLRIKGSTYQPLVEVPGLYDISVGEEGSAQLFTAVEAAKKNRKSLEVRLD